MTARQHTVKRLFDLFVSAGGILVFLPAGCCIALLLKIISGGPVFYMQERIGRLGRPYKCIKFRTMSPDSDSRGTITTAADSRITPAGRFLRKYKLDELPQLINVFAGKMSFVGPRPDVAGYADVLSGDDRRMLELRPGITGPATLFFRYEEELLASSSDPVTFNNDVVWPMKVRINLRYFDSWGFWKDIGYLLITVLPVLDRLLHLVPVSPRTMDEFHTIVDSE